jgi:glycosyltransferase involved in cell wall biosynthesis
MKTEEKLKISIVVPVYNESKALEKVLKGLKNAIDHKRVEAFEIITINDGSTDDSLNVLKKLKRRHVINQVINNGTNRGYGYSLKCGIKNAKYNLIIITDSDGAFPPNEINKLLDNISGNDMVIGSRVDKNAHIPPERIIPKKIVALVAWFLSGKRVPDINSGFRLFKKDLALKYWHLFPNGFSLTTTITIASLINGYNVIYIPVKCKKPLSKSSIKSVDFFYFTLLIIRLVVYYQPLRFFFWPGIVFILFGISLATYTLFTENNITDTEVLIFMTGVQTVFFGLIADLIVKTREGNK